MKPTIWVPRSFNEGAPKFVCRICRAKAYTPEQLASHIAAHTKQDEQAVRELSPRIQHPKIFGDEGVDTEWMDWHRKRGYHERPDW